MNLSAAGRRRGFSKAALAALLPCADGALLQQAPTTQDTIEYYHNYQDFPF